MDTGGRGAQLRTIEGRTDNQGQGTDMREETKDFRIKQESQERHDAKYKYKNNTLRNTINMYCTCFRNKTSEEL